MFSVRKKLYIKCTYFDLFEQVDVIKHPEFNPYSIEIINVFETFLLGKYWRDEKKREEKKKQKFKYIHKCSLWTNSIGLWPKLKKMMNFRSNRLYWNWYRKIAVNIDGLKLFANVIPLTFQFTKFVYRFV